jgi:hypothetical protein
MNSLLDLDLVNCVVQLILLATVLWTSGLVAVRMGWRRATLMEPSWTFRDEPTWHARLPIRRGDQGMRDERARLLMLGVALAKIRDDWQR